MEACLWGKSMFEDLNILLLMKNYFLMMVMRWDEMSRILQDPLNMIFMEKRSVSYPEACRLRNIGVHLTLYLHF